VNLERILDPESDEFKEVWKLYEAYFHSDERRTLEQQTEVMKNKMYKLEAAYKDGTLVGFIATWELRDFTFIEHMFIKKEFRKQGFGTALLVKKLSPGPVVLEVEMPEVSEEAAERIKWYQKRGFILDTFRYTQPPYDKTKKPVQMYLMTFPDLLTKVHFLNVKEQLYRNVYGITSPQNFPE